MSTFEFKAIRQTGEVYTGVMEAENDKELTKKVRDQGGVIVNSKNQEKGGLSFFRKFSVIGNVSTEDKIIFAKNLGAMIKAGLSVSKALATLEKQFKNPKFKNVIRDVSFDIKGGKTIYESLAVFPNIFSPLFIYMVKAGEESGKISDSLAIVGKQMENSNSLNKKVLGALIYPIIIIIAMIIVGILMLIFIVPTLQSTFADLKTELPFSTQLIISLSDFLKNYTILFVVGSFALIFSFIWGLKTKIGKAIFDTFVLKIPLISTIVKEVNSARTARTLASLLSSGVGVIESFSITEDVLQNIHYKKVLRNVRDNIQKGLPVADIFVQNENLYPPIVGAMIEVGEETGKLPEMLLNTAEFYEEEVAQKTKNMSTVIEPVLMLIVGAAVGFFAVSMITPMYSLMGGI
ncbi:type II secretion system F family protein [Patescibacteria group bacterium]|nr:type II secretion system F family protein [Patescibacteria group bacterium]MCG2694866.1 type II secretion system F family protein [Candidatus Parcubacteria bacterium]